MKPYNYSSCELPGHDSEFLNMVCVDHQCKSRQLLCSYCQQDHQRCKNIPLRKFTKIYQDQIDTKNLESLKQQNKKLNMHLDQIEATLDYSYTFLNNIFNQIKSSIHHLKQQVHQTQSDTLKQKQSLILQKFELEPSHDNFISLLAEIESFKPNSDKIPFKVKNNTTPNWSNEDIKQMENNGSQFSKAAQTLTNEYLNLFDTLKKSILKLFPTSFINSQNDNQSVASFKPIKNQQQQQQQQQSIQIENDQNILVTSNKQQMNELITKPIQKNVQLIEQSINNIKTEEKKQYHYDMSQQFQQSNINTLVPNSSNNPPIISSTQNNNQFENDTVLEVYEEKEFQFILEGSDITKILLINQNIIFGIGGSKFYIFDISSQNSKNENVQSIQTIQSDAEITDLAYFKMDEQNGQIYLATKKGNVLKLITEGIKNIKIKKSLMQSYKIDQPGMLQILINEVDRQLYSIGEDMIVKVWSLNTMKDLNSLVLKEHATAFHMDWKLLFIGGNNSIQIWDQITVNLIELEQKVKKILTNESKLFLGLENKIKIYNKTNQGVFVILNDLSIQKINLMQIIKTQSILVVSYIDQQEEKVGLYNFENEQAPQQLLVSSAQFCSIYEQNMINYLAFIQKTGVCFTYKMEQKSQFAQ